MALTVSQRLEPSQVNALQLASADGLHLPFLANSFDAVVGHVSMPYMNTRAAYLRFIACSLPVATFF